MADTLPRARLKEAAEGIAEEELESQVHIARLQKCNKCQDEGNSRKDSKRFLFDEDYKICY